MHAMDLGENLSDESQSGETPSLCGETLSASDENVCCETLSVRDETCGETLSVSVHETCGAEILNETRGDTRSGAENVSSEILSGDPWILSDLHDRHPDRHP